MVHVDLSAEWTRSEFLRRLAAGGGAFAAAAVLTDLGAETASSAPSRSQDVKILNFLLLLEYLQADMYSQAAEAGELGADLLQFATESARHERKHVAVIRKRLGRDARERPTFSFGSAVTSDDEFADAAKAIEEAAAAAYIGQGANLTRMTAQVVATVASVDARHAAWLRAIAGDLPAPRPADPAKSQKQVMAAIQDLGFLE